MMFQKTYFNNMSFKQVPSQKHDFRHQINFK